jgi:hypothetical protein
VGRVWRLNEVDSGAEDVCGNRHGEAEMAIEPTSVWMEWMDLALA